MSSNGAQVDCDLLDSRNKKKKCKCATAHTGAAAISHSLVARFDTLCSIAARFATLCSIGGDSSFRSDTHPQAMTAGRTTEESSPTSVTSECRRQGAHSPTPRIHLQHQVASIPLRCHHPRRFVSPPHFVGTMFPQPSCTCPRLTSRSPPLARRRARAPCLPAPSHGESSVPSAVCFQIMNNNEMNSGTLSPSNEFNFV